MMINKGVVQIYFEQGGVRYFLTQASWLIVMSTSALSFII